MIVAQPQEWLTWNTWRMNLKTVSFAALGAPDRRPCRTAYLQESPAWRGPARLCLGDRRARTICRALEADWTGSLCLRQVATSDGRLFPGRREDPPRIRRLQRRVSRARRGSKSRQKKVRALAREGAAHELSAKLVTGHDLIAVESLAIGAMRASACGTVEAPDRNVLAKAGLNRGKSEQAWGAELLRLGNQPGTPPACHNNRGAGSSRCRTPLALPVST